MSNYSSKVFLLLTAILGFSFSAFCQEDTENVLSPTYRLYAIKSPVKLMREWSVSVDELASNPDLDASDYKNVEMAIEEGILEEMSTSIREYMFDNEGKVIDWVKRYSGEIPVSVLLPSYPGVFNIKFQGEYPTQFSLQEFGDEMMGLDSFEIGLEEFKIVYDDHNLPLELNGKALEFFGGGEYTETYSKYKFDQNNNWIQRKIETPYDTLIQFRSYEY